MNKKIVLYVALTFILVSNVFSLGIAPSRKVIDYNPGTEIIEAVRVVNNEKENFSFTIIPEPATLLLFGLGTLMLKKKH